MGFDPVSLSLGIGSFVVGAASAIAQGVSSAQQAEAQQDAQNQYIAAQSAEYARAAELNNKAAALEYTEQSAAERVSQMQEQEAASKQAQEVQKEALQKKGAMMASTQGAGMALDYMLMDFDRQEASNRDDIRHQYEMRSVNSELVLSSYRDKAQNRINSQQSFIAPGGTSYNSGMNVLGTMLGIGNSAINAYGLYDKYNGKKPAAITPTGIPVTKKT